MQAGREIRVMVVPGALDDDGAVLLSHEIAREIEQELEYPGQIKVTVIRESRATDYARIAPMKRFHVTTFGCQMNEHDSERMKGMLESLGYAEAPERADADLILFNTCSIREKADERFVAHLVRGASAQARATRARDRRRRLLGAVGQGRGLPRSSRSSTSPSAPARCTSSPSS